MKTLLRFLTLLLISVVLVSCGKVTLELDTPMNVSIQDGIVTWDAVTDATEYIVAIGTNTYTVTTNSLDTTTLDLAAGDYQIHVVARDGTSVSLPSSTVTLTVEDSAVVLDAPVNIAIEGEIITWDAVTDATEYVVVIGADEFSVAVTTIDLATLDLRPGSFTIHIIAKLGTTVSPPSSTVSYFIEAADLDAVYSSVLEVLDESFVPDMTRESFDYDYEYDDYLMQSKLVLSFSEAVVALGLSEDEAIALFDQIYTLSERMDSVDTIAGLMTEIDTYAVYGIDSDDLAYLVLNMALTAIEIRNEDIEEELPLLEDELLLLQQQLTAARANDKDPIYALLLVHATTEQALLLEEFFQGEHNKTHTVIWTLDNIAFDLRYSFDHHDPYYLDDNDPYIQLFYDILEEAAIQEDIALLDLVLSDNQFDNLFLVHRKYMVVYRAQLRIDDLTDEHAQLEELSALFISQEDMMLESMELVFDYLSLIYDSLPSSLIALLDNAAAGQELTNEEYLIIKDEITTILLDTLLSAQDFSQLHTTMFTIASVLGGVDLDAHLAYVDFYGEVDHAVLDLTLTFIDSIDQTTIDEIEAITTDMIMPGGMHDYEKVIELTVYIGTYIQDFKSDNAAKFLVIETLLDSDQLEELFTIFANSLKSSLELEMDPEEFEIAEFLIDEVIADYDDIKEGLAIISDLGLDVVQEFLSTQGQIFIDIIALSDSLGTEPGQLFIADLEAILTQALSYNTVIFDNMDAATIEKLLGLIRIPLMMELAIDGDMTVEEFDLVFNDLATPVSTVLANIITIQQQFVTSFDALDFETLLYESSWNISEEDAYAALFIMAIANTFTTEIETLLAETIVVISDDILKNSTIMDMLEIDTTTIDEIISMIELGASEMILEAKAIAAFDYTAITPAELVRIQLFVETHFSSNTDPMTSPVI